MCGKYEHEMPVARTQGRRRRDRYLISVALPLVLCGAASAVSHAGPASLESTEIHLRYHRETLTSPAAARRLLAQIGDAALEACGASPFSLAEFKIAIRSTRCWRNAVDDAVRRIGSPTLIAMAREDGR